jgi:hypothetical protein
MTTPHHVGQVAKAEILVAHLLDTAPAGTDHQRQAAVIVNQLQTELGWTAPRDPNADIPPLRPERPALDEDSPGRREFAAARAELAARRTASRDTP